MTAKIWEKKIKINLFYVILYYNININININNTKCVFNSLSSNCLPWRTLQDTWVVCQLPINRYNLICQKAKARWIIPSVIRTHNSTHPVHIHSRSHPKGLKPNQNILAQYKSNIESSSATTAQTLFGLHNFTLNFKQKHNTKTGHKSKLVPVMTLHPDSRVLLSFETISSHESIWRDVYSNVSKALICTPVHACMCVFVGSV